jgi:hypothetical protein
MHREVYLTPTSLSWGNAYCILTSLELTHQSLGGLGFAITSQYYRGICSRRL